MSPPPMTTMSLMTADEAFLMDDEVSPLREGVLDSAVRTDMMETDCNNALPMENRQIKH